MVDPFKADGFSMMDLTASIKRLPGLTMRIGELGIFGEPIGISTRVVGVDEESGRIVLIEKKSPGDTNQMETKGTRKVRYFDVPYLPLSDVVLPSEYEGIRAFGSTDITESAAVVLNSKMAAKKVSHDITREFLRAGALQGRIYDASGSLIYNLFDEFVLDYKEIDLVLGTTTTDVLNLILEAKEWIEDHIGPDVITGYHCLMSPNLFRRFTRHTVVKADYQTYLKGNSVLISDNRKGFPYADVTFESYPAKAKLLNSTVKNFLDVGTAVLFPLGTNNLFKDYSAPAPFNETVNTLGEPYYAKLKERDFGMGYDILTVSNPLPMNLNPSCCVKLWSSTGL